MLERWRRRSTPSSPADDEAVLAGSGLFDAVFYRCRYHDVRDADLAPLTHFCHFGWREGRRPNVAFDPAWYARTHATGPHENPLVHYHRRGEAAGLRPVCFFDPRRYRRWHKLPRRRSALRHYLERRASDVFRVGAEPPRDDAASSSDEVAETGALAASGLFDASLYLVEGPDIRAAGCEPLAHYRRWGWREGRRPNSYFDPAWYRAHHLDGAEIDPLAHYVRCGEKSGLRPIATFDPSWYRRRYALPPGSSPLAHFLAHRRTQRYAPNGDFDLAFYMAGHGATLGPNRDPFAHFLLEGMTRDLDPSPGFDAAAYRGECMSHEPAAPSDDRSSAWRSAERQVPLVHFLDALP